MHDHLIRRIGEHGPPPRIRRCDVERDTLMAMVAMEEGVTPITNEPEPAAFTAVWSPHNRSAALKNLLGLAPLLRDSFAPISLSPDRRAEGGV